jgi:hypothetical protein
MAAQGTDYSRGRSRLESGIRRAICGVLQGDLALDSGSVLKDFRAGLAIFAV